MRRSLAAAALLLAPVALPAPARAAFDGAMMRDRGTLGEFFPWYLIEAEDIDGDGVDELLLGDGYGFALTAHDPVAELHLQIASVRASWVTQFSGTSLVDWDADGRLEVVALRQDGWFETYDTTGNLESRVLLVTGALGIVVADTDPSPGLEVNLAVGDRLEVYGSTGTALWSLALGDRVHEMTIANIDLDPALEIVVLLVSGDDPVVDTGSRAIEWTWPGGFGEFVSLGDLDGDGISEIVYGASSSRTFAVDGVQRTIRWSSSERHDGRPNLVDVDGDGRQEVVLLDALQISLLDGADGTLRAAIAEAGWSGSKVVSGQLDGDCETELLWVGGPYQTLRFSDPGTLALDWRQERVTGERGFCVGDSDADGHPEIVTGRSWLYPAAAPGNYLERYDLHHRTADAALRLTDGTGLASRANLLVQADADPAQEILLPGGTLWSGWLRAIDGATLAAEWTSAVFSSPIEGLASGDIDADGRSDILVALRDGGVKMLDSQDGSERWSSPTVSASVPALIAVADLDRDGFADLVSLTGGELSVRAGPDLTLRSSLFLDAFYALTLADLDLDLDPDILVGTAAGNLVGLDGRGLGVLFDENVATAPLLGLQATDLDGDGELEVLSVELDAASGRARRLAVYRLRDRARLWESQLMSLDGGYDAATLWVADADQDGRIEALVSSLLGIRVFEYGSAALDTVPPVFPAGFGPRATASMEEGCCASATLEWPHAWDEASPPVTYRVHRSLTAGFVPGAANRVAETSFARFRDTGLVAGGTYYYVVRSMDSLGNEDTNRSELRVDLPSGESVPADQGNVLRAFDPGMGITLWYHGATAARVEVFRGEARDRSSSSPVGAALRGRWHREDPPVPASGLLHYDIRGLSPCSNTPGP